MKELTAFRSGMRVSQRVQDVVVILVTANWAHAQGTPIAVAAADILCQDLRRKLTGERPSDRYFKDVGKLAEMILAGGFEDLAGIPREEIKVQVIAITPGMADRYFIFENSPTVLFVKEFA